jgi:hypothetical protein
MKKKYFEIIKALGSIQRDATNPFARAKYASLSNIQKHLNPLLFAQGCFLEFDFGKVKDGIYDVGLTLQDIDGEEQMEWRFAIPMDNTQKNLVQAFGATTTYAQRYALAIAFQIPLDDEDPDARASAPAPVAKQATPQLEPLTVGSKKYKDAVNWLATAPGASMAMLKTRAFILPEVEAQLVADAMEYDVNK